MSSQKPGGRFSWLRHGRLACQIIALILTVLGYFAIIRSFGMPKWLFVLSVMFLGLFFCGWACPFGSVQEWLRSLGRNVFGVTWRIPARVERYLLFSRYVVMGLGIVAMASFLDSRKTFVMAVTGNIAGAAAVAALVVVLALSLFVDRPYCKFICGFGALFGLYSMVRFVGVRRNGDACVGCGKCDHACQMGVEVSKAHNVRDPNCINCGGCVAACPVPSALTVGFTPLCRADLAALANKYRTSAGTQPRRGLQETRVVSAEADVDANANAWSPE